MANTRGLTLNLDNAALLVCIISEGTTSPGGGLWWLEEPDKQWHEPLINIYDSCFSKAASQTLISQFKRRTVLQLACGVGLDVDGVKELQEWMYR
jgi:hypothetical protein